MSDVRDIEIRQNPETGTFHLVTIYEIEGQIREHEDADTGHATREDAEKARQEALNQQS